MMETDFVDVIEMGKLVSAIESKDWNQLSKVKMGSKLRLVNPSAAWSQDIIGKNSNGYRYSKLPSMSSDRMASQMAEITLNYFMSDIFFRI